MLKVKGMFSLLFAVVLLNSSFQTLLGETHHVVPTTELQKELVKSGLSRQASLESLERLFARPDVAGTVQKTLGSQKRILEAVAVLSDEELARLAQRARGIEQDFAAGALSNQELTYIVIALATAVLILVIIVAGD